MCGDHTEKKSIDFQNPLVIPWCGVKYIPEKAFHLKRFQLTALLLMVQISGNHHQNGCFWNLSQISRHKLSISTSACCSFESHQRDCTRLWSLYSQSLQFEAQFPNPRHVTCDVKLPGPYLLQTSKGGTWREGPVFRATSIFNIRELMIESFNWKNPLPRQTLEADSSMTKSLFFDCSFLFLIFLGWI